MKIQSTKKNKVVAIIQARMWSSRLPNKMFLYLHGYPICEWVYKRVKASIRFFPLLFASLEANKYSYTYETNE